MGFEITCPECHGRGKMERVVWPELRAVGPQDVPVMETIQRVTEDCGKCHGKGFAARTEPVPVFQSGRRIGTVPASFDPTEIKSTSWLYDPRPGDFRREGDTLVAVYTLGPGDLEAVPGFIWDRE